MTLFPAMVGIVLMASPSLAQDWIPLFDGKSLKGWNETQFKGRGQLVIKDGTLIIGKGRLTGITWAGEFPKTSYEVRFEAARLEGSDFFAGITFPVGDSFCSWINGGWGGTVVGLSSLDGEDASDNDTSTIMEFETGRWYSFLLRVAPDRIQGWIDGKLIIDADIQGREVSLRPGEIDLNTPLGFATYATVGGLRKLEYRSIAR
ncbi:MAG: DUF1080 domain-containing protein [Bryobacterales bacterium]|nr:DUF1080 domain-containing protein [Bryobacterales bacterium]